MLLFSYLIIRDLPLFFTFDTKCTFAFNVESKCLQSIVIKTCVKILVEKSFRFTTKYCFIGVSAVGELLRPAKTIFSLLF